MKRKYMFFIFTVISAMGISQNYSASAKDEIKSAMGTPSAETVNSLTQYDKYLKDVLSRVDTVVVSQYTGKCQRHFSSGEGGGTYEYFFKPQQFLKGNEERTLNLIRGFNLYTDSIPKDPCQFYKKGKRYLILARKIKERSRDASDFPSEWFDLVESHMAISLEK